MAAETANLKNLARRVKQKALEHAEAVLEDNEHKVYSKEIYDQTYLTVLKNAVPRTQEVTGEDGGALVIQISKEVAAKNSIGITGNEVLT